MVFYPRRVTGVCGIFRLYAFARSGNVELFNHYQQTLNRDIGAANTIILITGSLFVVLAVQAIKAGKALLCRNWLLAGMGMGMLFVTLKLIEFTDKFAHGISLSTNIVLYVLPVVDVFSFHARQ